MRLVFILAILLTLGVGNAWGTDYSFLSSIPSGWSVSPSQNSFESSNNGTSTFGRGACWTKGADPAISATGISGTITEVTVNASTNAGASQASISVTVGGTNFKNNNNNSVYIATGTASARASYTFTGSATGTVAVSINNAKSDKSVWVNNITVTTGGGCSYTVTLSYDGDAASHGEFVLKAGSAAGSTISEGGTVANCGSGTTVVALCPQNVDDHYHLEASNITATNKTGSITSDGNGNFLISYTQGGNVSSSVSVTFTEDTKYTVTWMSNGSQHTTTQVYSGEKPTFPSNPSSCDATSDTFYGWTTAAWTGTLDDVSAKTIYTSAASMPAVTGAVTYYAVFAKETTSATTYKKGTSADLTEGQTVVIVNKYYEVALSSEESGNGYDAVSLSISSNKFTSSNTSILWTVEVGSSGFYFKQGDNYINASPDDKGNHYLWFDEYSDEWTLTGSGPYVLYSTEDDGYQMEYYYSSDYFTTYTGTSGNAYNMDFYIPEVTYSKYLTNCCTNLGYINGSFF